MNKKEKALKVVDERILLWRGRATEAPLASPYSHLTLVGELELIRERIEKAL